jgi:hypothetical protein
MLRSSILTALALGTASASATNTQVNGITLTNGLSSLTNSSGLYSGPNKSYGVTYLTDNDTTTFNFNLGIADGGSIQGTFDGTIASSSTGVYILGIGFEGTTLNGSFLIQLNTLSGLTASRSYSDANFTVTNQSIGDVSGYQNFDGQAVTYQNIGGNYAYLYAPFSDFGISYNQVLGIKLSNFSPQYPDLSYIGIGAVGNGGAIPEPSTYGLIGIGALGVAFIARRRKLKTV